MRVLSVVLAVALGVGGIAAAFWYGGHQPGQIKDATSPGGFHDDSVGPPVSATGPYPHAEVGGSREHNFGVLMQGATGKHVFTIRNTGEAPLELMARKEDRTCQCTGATLSDEGPVPPGGEVAITVNWEVKSDAAQFRHLAKIRTNDPQNRIIELVVFGRVDSEYHIEPSQLIELGEALDDQPVSGKAVIYSRTREQFGLLDAVASEPRLNCTWQPLSEEQLQQYEAKSGYALSFQMDPKGVVGMVSESLRLRSDEKGEDGEPLLLAKISVRLKKPGPIEVIGRNWDDEYGRLALGEFPAKEGTSGELSVYVQLEGALGLESVEPSDSGIGITWEKDERFQSKEGNRQRYKLRVQIPPGSPVNRQRSLSEKLILKFDRPEIGSLQLRVDYLSL
ncbi:MAG: DUF1573 domain-containing protein [Planctomycetaceae bacterium]